MNIQETIKKGGNAVVMVTTADLKEFALSIVEALRSEENDRKKLDGTMSQKEAATYLGKSVSTLIRWGKTGYLKPCSHVGASPQYSIEQLKKIKEGK